MTILQMRSVSVPFLVSLMITPPTLSLEGTLLVILPSYSPNHRCFWNSVNIFVFGSACGDLRVNSVCRLGET